MYGTYACTYYMHLCIHAHADVHTFTVIHMSHFLPHWYYIRRLLFLLSLTLQKFIYIIYESKKIRNDAKELLLSDKRKHIILN